MASSGNARSVKVEGTPMAAIIDRIMRAGEGKILRELSKIVDMVNGFES